MALYPLTGKIDGKIIDKLIFKFNGFLADYTIFFIQVV